MNKGIIAGTLLVIGYFFLISFGAVSAPRTVPLVWLRNDKVIHFLSGFVLAYGFSLGFKISKWRWVIFWIAALGIGWEIFENVFLIAFDQKDTIIDIVFDFAGGAAFLFLRKIILRIVY